MSPRYRFFAGKGGVGKTTCAAAFALSLSRRARTLVVSTDPAHSLGDALEMRLAATPRRVRGSLYAAEMNADRALSRWLGARERSLRSIAARGTYLDDEDIDALFRLSLPGVDELVGLIELERLGAGFEEVVVDTAPTGHTLRLLGMPRTLADLARVLDDLQAKHRALLQSLRGSYRRDAEDDVIEELRQRAESLRELLRDGARAEFHWVMLAEELSLAETRDGIAALREEGMPVERAIANRITPAPVGRCALCSSRRAIESTVLREARSLGLPLDGVEDQSSEPRGLRALARVSAQLQAPFRLSRSAGAAQAPAAVESEMPLELLTPKETRLLFFGGKGGVGKTTAAAVTALHLAGSGAQVLLLSTDPAHSLGDVLGLPLGDDERQVAPRLWAREVDATRAFAARRERYRRNVQELFETLRGGSQLDVPYDRAVMENLIDLAPPGLDEVFGLLAIGEALRRDRVVVVDTAPTGHALRLLELVPKAREWAQVMLEILLKYRRVVGLGQLAKDVTETARELRVFEELLHDPARARFVAVARAAELPRRETERLLAALRRLRIPAPVVLVNALTPPGCSRCRRIAAEEGRQIERLRRRRRGWAMLGAPAVAPPPRGAEALLRFGRTWTRIE